MPRRGPFGRMRAGGL